MDIIIKNSDSRPIYSQIEEQIKQAIITEQLPEGAMLPSMRVMAKELRISLITIKRAYEDLERDGFIYTVAGKGCFVAPKNMELVRENSLKEMENLLSGAVELAKLCSISAGELADLIKEMY